MTRCYYWIFDDAGNEGLTEDTLKEARATALEAFPRDKEVLITRMPLLRNGDPDCDNEVVVGTVCSAKRIWCPSEGSANYRLLKDGSLGGRV